MTEVWYVIGDPDHFLFATKMAAEIYARQLFPEADPDARYARIRFKNVYTESDLKGLPCASSN